MTDSFSSVVLGINVSKDKLDLARSDASSVLTFNNNADGIRQIIQIARDAHCSLIVVEATGGYEQLLVDALLEEALPVSRVNPRNVRHAAKADGQSAKTDRIDAAVLVDFGLRYSPRLLQKRSQNQDELHALITCRRQLVASRAMHANQRKVTANKTAGKTLDRIIDSLDGQIRKLNSSIQKLIDSDDDMHRFDSLVRSVPGVGAVLSATLLAELSQIGHIGRRRLSALVGVAPFAADSGKHRGKRFIRGGRTSVRCTLYMATIAAIRCNPILKRFSQRLSKAGKPSKVVIVACMHKLLGLLNAMVRDGLTWDQLNLVKKA